LPLLTGAPTIALLIPSSVTENDINVTLRCVADGYPNSYHYGSWNHTLKGKTIRSKLCDHENVVCSNVQLVFKTVTYEDSGCYSCAARNGVKSKNGTLMQYGTAYLRIQG